MQLQAVGGIDYINRCYLSGVKFIISRIRRRRNTLVNICHSGVRGPKHAALRPVADNARRYPLQVWMAIAPWTIAKLIPFQLSQMPFPWPIVRFLWRADLRRDRRISNPSMTSSIINPTVCHAFECVLGTATSDLHEVLGRAVAVGACLKPRLLGPCSREACARTRGLRDCFPLLY